MQKLTDVFCQKAKAKASRTEYADPTGLRLVVQPSGKKSWAVRARLNDQQIKITLGPYPAIPLQEARQRALAVLARVAQGEDPRVERATAKENTVRTVFEKWMSEEQGLRRGGGETRNLFEKRVLPTFGHRPVASVTSAEIAAFLDGVADEVSLVRSRRVRAKLRRFFEYCVEKFLIQFNPVAAVKPRGKEKRRQRYLSDTETALLWNAATTMGYPLGDYTRLTLLTGSRRAEILFLKWQEIDFKKRRILLEGERTKNGEPHVIPLNNPAIELLRGLPRFANSDLVFTHGERPLSDSNGFKEDINKLISGLNDENPIPDWRVHDFRRTVAVFWQSIGYSKEVIEAILGHLSGSKSGIVGTYQVYDFLGERKKALDEWGEHVLKLVSEKETQKIKKV